ncbi:MAG TPA: hypothetical protein VIS99_15270 [Terrimicrobiaceae bacterium]
MREKGDKPKPEPKWARESLVMAYPHRANSRRRNYSGFAAPTPEPFCAGCWPNCRPASTTNARLTSTRSRREYPSACERAGKGGKQIERCVISTFQVAESMGFKGDYRQWQELLRIGD